MPALYGLRDGVLVEPVGDIWAAFSSASGDSVLLNNESAAVLEALTEGPATTDRVCHLLAAESGDDPAALRATVDLCWPMLIEAGLVEDRVQAHCRGVWPAL